jgi:hypothetical protein
VVFLSDVEQHIQIKTKPKGKYLVVKIEFGGSFGMSLEGDCHEVEVTPNLEYLVTFGVSLEGVCNELYTYFHKKATKNTLKKAPS